MRAFDAARQQRAGRSLRAWAERIETDATLDERAAPLDAAAGPVARAESLHDLLRGTWLGHSLHPLLTDFPLGSWISASLLDLFGGDDARRAAQGLVGFGVAAAIPTALAGLADWADTTGGARRVGVVHGAMNAAILACYTASWLARRRDRHAVGVALALVGGTGGWVSGYLGGHLSLVRNTGMANRERDDAYQPTATEEDEVVPPERERDAVEEEAQSGPVVHGGKDDPLGGGVADLEESEEVSEGVPEQDGDPASP